MLRKIPRPNPSRRSWHKIVSFLMLTERRSNTQPNSELPLLWASKHSLLVMLLKDALHPASMPLHPLENAESIITSGRMKEAYSPEHPRLFQKFISHTKRNLVLNFPYLFFGLKSYFQDQSTVPPV